MDPCPQLDLLQLRHFPHPRYAVEPRQVLEARDRRRRAEGPGGVCAERRRLEGRRAAAGSEGDVHAYYRWEGTSAWVNLKYGC